MSETVAATLGSPLGSPLAAPQTILLIKTSSLGDVIHNLPVASDLKRRFPDARIDWVVEEAFVDIPRMHPAIHKIIPVALRRWRKRVFQRSTWHEIAQAKQQLQETAYDLVIDTQGLIKSAVLTHFSRTSLHGQRCGYAAEAAREPLAARFYDAHFAIPKNVHAVERNRWLAAAACDNSPDLPLDYGLSHITTTPLDPTNATPYAVLLTATSRDDKLWPENDWCTLMTALCAQGMRCLLPSGTPIERERAQRIASRIPKDMARVLPPSSITQLAELFAGARLVVGVDTGLTHLATAIGRPTLAIFCASNPGLTGLYAGDPPITPVINLGQAGMPPDAHTVTEAALSLID